MFGVTLLLALLPGSARAQEEGGKAAAKEALTDPAFREWLEALRDEARGKGISDATLEGALRDLVPVMRVIELDRAPAGVHPDLLGLPPASASAMRRVKTRVGRCWQPIATCWTKSMPSTVCRRAISSPSGDWRRILATIWAATV